MPDSTERPPPSFAAPLGRIAGRGFLWLLLAAGFGKGSALIGQIILGWLLFAEDWGLYALALSIAAFVQIFRDGGVSKIIIQSGKDQYEGISGPAFWMALTFNVMAAVILVAAAPVVSSVYGQPDLKPMLWIVAAAFICGTPATVFWAYLNVDLRFSSIGWLRSASAIIRWGTAVGMAAAGFGPMSFMWAMLASTVFDSLAGWVATRDRPWARKAIFASWPRILKKSLWVMIGSVAAGLASNGSYFILGLMLSLTLLGRYSFGSHLSAQLGVLVAVNLQAVLFPTLTRMVGEPQRLAAGLERATGVLFLISAAPALLLAASAQPLELLIWDGKWASAVMVIQVYSVVLPFRMIVAVPYSVLLAQGRFAAHAGIMIACVAALLVAAFTGASLFGENLGAIAATIGISQAAFALVMSFWILQREGCDLRRLIASVVKPWSVACIVGGCVWVLDQNVFDHFVPLVRLLLIGALYTVALGLLARQFLLDALLQLLAVTPKRIGRVLTVAMRIP